MEVGVGSESETVACVCVSVWRYKDLYGSVSLIIYVE